MKRPRKFGGTLAVIALPVLLIPCVAAGQDVAVGSATATVVTTISVTASSPLALGDVMQGVPSSVANNSGSAAIFEITGQGGSGADLYLQLPEYLALSDGSDRMTITFSSTDASVDTTGAADPTTMNASKGWQNTNPYNLPAAAVIGAAGTDVYLGGKVIPSPNQKAGSYSGDIVLTVAYNGN
ncbi:MAG: DUF4402 domain-containing protein [candidate division Zixibacteria bacterium]